MTFNYHEHIIGGVPEPEKPARASDLDVPRAPWRKVKSVVKLRRGWAIFLECQGHIMFLDSLDARWGGSRPSSPEPGFTAPADAGPRKMRCTTCAGLAHPSYIHFGKPSPADIRCVLEGREGELRRRSPQKLAAANRHIEHLSARFVERVRRGGVEEGQRAVAEAAGRGRRR